MFISILIWLLIITLTNLIVLKLKTKCVEMRYLEFGENDRRWVTIDEYYKLLKDSKCIYPGFVDITDLVDPEQTYYDIVRERSDMYRMLRAAPKKLTQQTLVKKLIESIQSNRMYNIIKTLSNYNNRYAESDTGKQASEYLYDYVSKLVKNTRCTVEYFKHKSSKQQSIIIKLPGTQLPDEIVIYCAHFDTINTKSPLTGKAPGADDNASGISNVLEVFAVLVSNNVQLKRTVEFHLYAAEELGLKGSTEIAEKYKKDNKNVIAVFNNDMTGYSEDGKNAYVLNGKSDIVDAELVDLCKQLAPVYTNLIIKDGGCGYSCTDNFSWARFGYPACALSEGSPQNGKLNPYIHSDKDTIDHINLPYCVEHSKFGLAFVIETSMM
jgi:leucyl aminopeptidase